MSPTPAGTVRSGGSEPPWRRWWTHPPWAWPSLTPAPERPALVQIRQPRDSADCGRLERPGAAAGADTRIAHLPEPVICTMRGREVSLMEWPLAELFGSGETVRAEEIVLPSLYKDGPDGRPSFVQARGRAAERHAHPLVLVLARGRQNGVPVICTGTGSPSRT